MFGAKPLGNTSSFNLGPTSGFSLNKPFGASTGIGTGFGTGTKGQDISYNKNILVTSKCNFFNFSIAIS